MTDSEPPRQLRISNPSPPSPDLTPSRLYHTRVTIQGVLPASPFHGATLTRERGVLPSSVPNPPKTINFHLLRTQCYLSLDKPILALQQAEIALHIARNYNLYNLEAKSQYYRAKCLLMGERFPEARKALVRAAGIWDWEGKVRNLGWTAFYEQMNERARVELDRGMLKQVEVWNEEKREEEKERVRLEQEKWLKRKKWLEEELRSEREGKLEEENGDLSCC